MGVRKRGWIIHENRLLNTPSLTSCRVGQRVPPASQAAGAD